MTLQYSHQSWCMLVYCSPLGKLHQLPILANEQSPLTWNTTLMAYFFFFINYLLGKHFYSILKIKSNKDRIAVQNSCSVRGIQIQISLLARRSFSLNWRSFQQFFLLYHCNWSNQRPVQVRVTKNVVKQSCFNITGTSSSNYFQ